VKALRARVGRLRRGESIAAISALALLASLFLDWFGAELGPYNTRQLISLIGYGGNAWQSLDLLPWFLLLVVLVTLGAAVLALRGSSWRPVVPLSAAVAVLGGLAALLVLLQLIFPPDYGAIEHISIETNVEPGAFLALIAACGVAFGGYRAMGDEGDSFEAIAERLSGQGGRARRARG
jgi:hypothetical protein